MLARITQTLTHTLTHTHTHSHIHTHTHTQRVSITLFNGIKQIQNQIQIILQFAYISYSNSVCRREGVLVGNAEFALKSVQQYLYKYLTDKINYWTDFMN